MGRKSSDDKRRKGKDKAREKFARNGKHTSRCIRFKERMLAKRARAQTGKEMNKNGKHEIVACVVQQKKKRKNNVSTRKK